MTTFEQEQRTLRMGAKGARTGRQAFVNIVVGKLYEEVGYATAKDWLSTETTDLGAVHELRWTHSAIEDRRKVVQVLYPEDWSQTNLAELLGVDQMTISHDLKALDIDTTQTDGRGRLRGGAYPGSKNLLRPGAQSSKKATGSKFDPSASASTTDQQREELAQEYADKRSVQDLEAELFGSPSSTDVDAVERFLKAVRKANDNVQYALGTSKTFKKPARKLLRDRLAQTGDRVLFDFLFHGIIELETRVDEPIDDLDDELP